MKKLIILLCTWLSLTAGAAFDFGNAQVGIHEILAPKGVKSYLFTAPDDTAYIAGVLTFATDPNSRGSAQITATVSCEGVTIATQTVLVNTASARDIIFPIKAKARCGFTLTSPQGQGFGLKLGYRKAAVVTVPRR